MKEAKHLRNYIGKPSGLPWFHYRGCLGLIDWVWAARTLQMYGDINDPKERTFCVIAANMNSVLSIAIGKLLINYELQH